MNTKNRTELVSIALALAFLGACASNPNKAKDIEKVDTRAAYQGESIGMNDNKEVIIQKQTGADVELRNLGWQSYDLERKIQSDHELLTRCREELADPRLGGSGSITDIPEIDTLKPPSQVKDELGIAANGQLKVVKKEMYLERLNAEREYVETLRQQQKVIAKHKTNCERQMKITRVKFGLPAERYTSKGHFKNGSFVQTRRAENSLDDAFSIASEEAAAHGSDAKEKAVKGDTAAKAPAEAAPPAQ
jgi:hypothetical protein